MCYPHLHPFVWICRPGNLPLPADQKVRWSRRSESPCDTAAVLKTPQAAETKTKPPPGRSDAPGWLQVWWNYPESSGPLGEFCWIKWKCSFCGVNTSFHWNVNNIKHSISPRFVFGFSHLEETRSALNHKHILFYLIFFNNVANSTGCCFSTNMFVFLALVAGFEPVSNGMTGAVFLVTHGNCLACPWGE